MVQRSNNTAIILLLQFLSSSLCVQTTSNVAVMAWSSPPTSSSTNTRQRPSSSSPLFSTVDEVYYNPTSTTGGVTTTNIFETTLDSTSSEELEIAARNYGGGTSAATNGGGGQQKITLTRWLQAKVQDYPELRDMESLHLSIQMACKTISNLIHSSTTAKLSTTAAVAPVKSDSSSNNNNNQDNDNNNTNDNNLRDNSMKRLDQISKNVLQNALRFTGRLRVVEAPRGGIDSNGEEEGPAAHQPGVTIAYALDSYGKEGSGGSGGGTTQRKSRKGARKSSGSSSSGSSSGAALKEKRLAAYADAKWGKTRRLAAFFDPLDGSGNADAAIPTGTVFGVFDADAAFPRGEIPDMKDTASLARAVLQPGNSLLAAGYCMYSSTTILVFTLGGGTHGFTLDPTINEFVLTHPNMKIPKRGNIYSCNEAYSEGWDDNFKQYLKTIKTGKGESGQRYTQRYIGSMVGDVHRTLMYGGIFCCPSDTEVHHNGNLQLVYKSAPMAYILEHAGGKSTNGENNLLSVKPERVHQRSPCFMGSPEDMDELMTYMSGEQGASQ
ncbi:fructose-1,6-bisphosphatase [Skeletonema marinoi]|uniref:fructose-bisphosphatase n=1 Tax=Skeletonema marinoi TaxID=267567 RepID=A0AAD8Y1Z6_9STRA|nr:fructose-1,6-bisphosphatase [Skeletonema marinoi]